MVSYSPGFRLRQIRERLGLTYRDVQRASLALARLHTRPQFAVHISRLADIENGGVVPSLHKLYALAVVYHLNLLEILRWYDIPLDRFLCDAVSFAAPQTHLMESRVFFSGADKPAPSSVPNCTGFMPRNSAECGGIENILNGENGHHRYGYIGLQDRRMVPILRPGSVVLVDVSVRRLEESEANGPMNTTGQFILLNYMTVTAADGFRRRARVWRCSPIRCRGACRNPGKRQMMRKSSAE
jgi:transcriptional regulator with XRE-family HTH domain